MSEPTLAEKLLAETKAVLLAQGRARAANWLSHPSQVEVVSYKDDCLLCGTRLKGLVIRVGCTPFSCLTICPNRPECRARILEQAEARSRDLEKTVIP